MKLGIISDLHSNLEALTSVLNELDRTGVDEIICLGDVVGYGPNPNECIEIVRKVCRVVLAGNHDYAAVELEDTNYFNVYAARAVEWTQKILTEDNIKYLKSLPISYSAYDCFFVHATPQNPLAWDYIVDMEDAFVNFQHFTEKICFIGHSHIPQILMENDNKISICDNMHINIQKDHRLLINIGSVGQPRDRRPESSFGILDFEEQMFVLRRCAYQFTRTQAKMRVAGLPEFLITRLAIGY